MSNTMRRSLAMLLVLMMCLSILPLPASAEEPEEIASSVSAVDAELEETVALPVTEGDLMDGAYAGEQDEELFPAGSATDIKEGTESLGGTEELTPDGNQIDLGGDDDTLGFGEEVGSMEGTDELEEFKDTQVEFGEASDVALGDGEGTIPDDTEDLGLYGATVSAARNSVVLNKGNSTTIQISYSNAPKNGSLKVGAWKNILFTSDAVSLSWGKPSGGKVPLTIKGSKTGTCYVEVFLCNSLGIPYAVTQIKVNVCEASLTCTSDLRDFKVTKGASKTLFFRAGGYTGESEITYTTTNNSAYTCALRDGALTVTGKKMGSGTVRVYYKAKATGDTLAMLEFPVTTVEPSVPKLSVSSAGVSLTAGASRNITVSFSGYDGAVYMRYGSNSSAVQCAWYSGWTGNSRVLQVSGLQNGSATITVYLMSADNVQLATAKIQVTVAPKPEISPGSATLSLVSGNSGTVTFTLKNVTDQNTLVCKNNASNICSAALSKKNGSYVLTVAGKNAGSATLTVSVRDAFGNDVASSQVLVTVKAAPPTLTASAGSLKVSAGATKSVTFTYANCTGKVGLSASKSSSNCILSWGNWNGRSIPLNIKAVEPGTCTISVQLLQNSVAVLTKTITVTVEPKTLSLDIKEVSYSFSNYSTVLSERICKKVFKNNEIANNVYKYAKETNLGGGVCYGMATSSGLLYGRTVPVSTFGSSMARVYDLKKSSKSNSLGITTTDFIEMMHVAQVSTTRHDTVGIHATAQGIMSEIDNGRVAFVGIRGLANGKEAGHRVEAFGYSLSGNTLSVSIYDPNSPGKAKTMTFTRPSQSASFDTWSFDMGGHGVWGSGKKHAKIYYSTYANISKIWSDMGNLNSNAKSSENLVCTTEGSFTLYTVDFEKNAIVTALKVENGSVTEQMDGVYNAWTNDVDSTEHVYMFWLPEDYYYVSDDTPADGITISIVDEYLSTTIQTDVSDPALGAMGFCAGDAEQTAEASVSVVDGAAYQISIGSTTEDGVSKTIVKEGIGSGQPVNLGLSAGMLSLGSAEDSEGAMVTEAYTVSTYEIDAYAGEGGRITSEGPAACAEGENCLYRIAADEGYCVDRVYVDGEDVGPVSAWYFEDVCDDHTIAATFKRDISDFVVRLDQSTFAFDGTAKVPEVVVSNSDGDILTENVDYWVCCNDNVQPGKATVLVMALADSAYYGTAEAEFVIEGSADAMIRSAAFTENELNVTLDAAAFDASNTLVAAVYDESGKLLLVRTTVLAPSRDEIAFPLDAELPENAYAKLYLVSGGTYAPRTSPYYLWMTSGG